MFPFDGHVTDTVAKTTALVLPQFGYNVPFRWTAHFGRHDLDSESEKNVVERRILRIDSHPTFDMETGRADIGNPIMIAAITCVNARFCIYALCSLSTRV